MNILYCGDEGIRRGVLVSILSLMKYATEPLEIYILTIKYENVKPFSLGTAEFLDRLVKKGVKTVYEKRSGAEEKDKIGEEKDRTERFPGNEKSFVKLIDATEVFVENLPKKNMGSYFTPCSMLRLYVDKIPELRRLDRILYLDYDVVCRKDIAKFYHTDLEGVEVAGVLDIYGKNFYHYNFPKTDYINSGVMLFNISECLKSGMFEKAVRLCAKRWMMLADQAALNKAISRRKLMPRKYNEQRERPKTETVLHHFSNNFKFLPFFHVQKVKPFEVEKIHRILKITEYDDILEEYRKLEEMKSAG